MYMVHTNIPFLIIVLFLSFEQYFYEIAEYLKSYKDYRQFFFSIFHKFCYEGKKWSIRDVYNKLLHNKDYRKFRKMFNYNRNILNNMRDEDNSTYLILASWLNNVRVVEYLINVFKDHIDVWAVDNNGRNAYHHAAEYNNVDVMKHLLSFDRSRLDVGDNDGKTPLHSAAMFNNKRIVNLLLNAGASTDVVENTGQTPDRFADDVEIKKIIQDHRTKSSS